MKTYSNSSSKLTIKAVLLTFILAVGTLTQPNTLVADDSNVTPKSPADIVEAVKKVFSALVTEKVFDKMWDLVEFDEDLPATVIDKMQDRYEDSWMPFLNGLHKHGNGDFSYFRDQKLGEFISIADYVAEYPYLAETMYGVANRFKGKGVKNLAEAKFHGLLATNSPENLICFHAVGIMPDGQLVLLLD